MTARRSPVRLLLLLVAALPLVAGTGCNLSSGSSSNGSAAATGTLQPSAANLQFGTVPTASSKVLSETLTNSGGAAVTISQIASSAGVFRVTGVNPPVTLSPGQAVTFNVAFAPQSSGEETGQLSVASNASNATLAVGLSGAGTSPGSLAVAPAIVNFGSVTVGSSKSQTATLSAANGPVTVSAAGLSSSEFSLSGLALPLTIPAGSTVPFTLIFSPQSSGSASGTLTFTASASNSGISESLSGTGTAPGPHSVTLNWNPSASIVDGYNVYRGTISGGPYTRINSALDTATSAMDNAVIAGQTYYYVVTAVAGSKESAYSNQATAVIPYP